MYGKIFESIYDGSLSENWKTMVVFQQFIILADENGVVDMTPEAIARRTNIPIQIILEAIEELEKPDGESRSSEEDGRRLIKTDPQRGWGWKLVNSGYYRKLAKRKDKLKADRERIAAKREKDNNIKGVAPSRKQSQVVAKDRLSDTYSDTDKERNTKERKSAFFKTFWETYPKKVDKEKAIKAFNKINPDEYLLKLMLASILANMKSDDWLKEGGKFIPYPATWLNNKRWEDEVFIESTNAVQYQARDWDEVMAEKMGEDKIIPRIRNIPEEYKEEPNNITLEQQRANMKKLNKIAGDYVKEKDINKIIGDKK